MEFDNNAHSVFLLHYHLVPVVKYRRKVFDDAVSERAKSMFPGIKTKLWKEYFWSQSFCLMTAGGAPLSVIKQYIESQGEKR